MAKRKIIKIDEEKCNGCGLCIPNCAEGALQMIDGKARLISELLCDGLGACIGKCPQGAITIEEREVHHRSTCPGSKIMEFTKKNPVSAPAGIHTESALENWPVQIKLVPPFAPFLNNADILIAADCVPFAYAAFHQDLLRGKSLLVGCPKLDDIALYQEKITQMVENNDIKSITYARMEVPCCAGMAPVIKQAIKKSGKNVFYQEVVIGIKGERLS